MSNQRNIRIFQIFRLYGVREAVGYIFSRLFNRIKGNKAGDILYPFLPGSTYPISCRRNTSDEKVFKQIFREKEYNCLDNVSSPECIIDCGCNVGYASVYFLQKYPNAHVVGVEPEPDNFTMAERNLKPFKDRVTLHQKGVWSHNTGLMISQGTYRDGGNWATQVSEAHPSQTPDIEGTDIGALLDESGFNRINILKIDIERSEAEVFARNYEYWLPRVDNIIIELHDQECEDIFFKALEDYDYELSHSGELTVCRKIKKKEAVAPPKKSSPFSSVSS